MGGRDAYAGYLHYSHRGGPLLGIRDYVYACQELEGWGCLDGADELAVVVDGDEDDREPGHHPVWTSSMKFLGQLVQRPASTQVDKCG